MLDVTQADALRRALQQDLAAAPHQRQRREEDHDGDGHAHGRVGVEARRRLGEPDHHRRHDHPNVVERVPRHVQQRPQHAQVPPGRLDRQLDVPVLRVHVSVLELARVSSVVSQVGRVFFEWNTARFPPSPSPVSPVSPVSGLP